MSYELEVLWAASYETRWTPAAVDRLVGQRPAVNGKPGEVVAAWQDEAGVHVRVRAEGELPDVSGIVGYPVGPGGERL